MRQSSNSYDSSSKNILSLCEPFEEEAEHLQNFILEKDTLSKSQLHITMKKYRYVLYNFWVPVSKSHFNLPIFRLKKMHLRQIRNLMKNSPISEINPLRQDLKKEYYSEATIKNYFAVLSSYLQFLTEERIIESNLLKQVKIPAKPKRNIIYLNDNEILLLKTKLMESMKKYQDNTPPRYYMEIMIILFPILTGVRVSEQASLNIEDIQENGVVRIIGKGNKERFSFLPIEQESFALLWNKFKIEREQIISFYLKKFESIKKIDRDGLDIGKTLESYRNEKALFLNNFGKRISVRSIQRRVSSIRHLIPSNKQITPHKLRHTFATRLLNGEIDLYEIKQLLGHSHVQTTERYLHANEEKIGIKLKKKSPFQDIFQEEIE